MLTKVENLKTNENYFVSYEPYYVVSRDLRYIGVSGGAYEFLGSNKAHFSVSIRVAGVEGLKTLIEKGFVLKVNLKEEKDQKLFCLMQEREIKLFKAKEGKFPELIKEKELDLEKIAEILKNTNYKEMLLEYFEN